MKKYKIIYEEAYDVIVEAENEDEAVEAFTTGEYSSTPHYREITGYEVYEEN